MRRAFFLTTLFLTVAVVAAPVTSFLVTKRKLVLDDKDHRKDKMFIRKQLPNGKPDPSFREIDCKANPTEMIREKCFPVEKEGENRFLVADCFSHPTVGVTCTLRRYEANGQLDPSFNYSKSGASSDKSFTTDIQNVTVFSTGTLVVAGEFINPTFHSESPDRIHGALELKRDGSFIHFDLAKPNKK